MLALLAMAGLLLHELRYMSWLGAEESHAGSHRFDGLLAALGPALTALVTIAAAVGLVAVARARTGVSPLRVRIRNVWPIASGALLAIYSWQELLQGALDANHPFGLHGAFGHGGWIVVPLALLLGGLVAMAVGLARELERRRGCPVALELRWPAVERPLAAPVVRLVRVASLAENLAGRSPPAPVV